jgi:hypothetical protein
MFHSVPGVPCAKMERWNASKFANRTDFNIEIAITNIE